MEGPEKSPSKECQDSTEAECELAVATPPDGGWGWVVTFSSFMVSFLVDGVCFTFGIFFPFFLDSFGESKGKTSILGAVSNGSYLSMGPIAGALVNKFGCRKVSICGGIISCIGLFLSTFSPTLDVMIVLYGFVGGGGFGLIYLPAIVMVGYYFDKRRAFATGMAVCGSGIGGFVFAPMSVFLIETYGWKGAMWIVSGIVLNGVVFATFYRPLPVGKTQNKQLQSVCCQNEREVHKNGTNEHAASNKKCFFIKNKNTEELKSTPIYRCKSVEIQCSPNGNNSIARLAFSQDLSSLNENCSKSKHTHLSPLVRKDIFYSGSLRNIPEHQKAKTEEEYVNKMLVKHDACKSETKETTCCDKVSCAIKGTFDFSLLGSPTFIVYGISCFLCMFGFFIPFNFLPALANDLKMTANQGALLISVIGISNTVTRILVGFVSDQPWADCLLINNISLLVGGTITCLVPYYKVFGILATYSVLFGAAIAAFVSLRSIIMVELMGIEKLTNAFGLVVLCQGLSSFIGSPIAGSLADLTGDYNIAFYLSGGTLALAGLICLPLRRIAKWENNRTQNSSSKDNVLNVDKAKVPEETPMLAKS